MYGKYREGMPKKAANNFYRGKSTRQGIVKYTLSFWRSFPKEVKLIKGQKRSYKITRILYHLKRCKKASEAQL